jgi:hypothetical protein
MTPYFLEDNVVVVAVLMVSALVWILIKIYHYCKTDVREQKGHKTTIVESQLFDRVKLKANQLYQIIIFPFAAGFMTVLLVSAYVNQSHVSQSTEYQSFFPEVVDSLALFVGIFIVSVVFGI